MTVRDPTVDALEAGLDKDPEDWGLRLVLADALDDAGDPVGAFGQRWMATWTVAPRWVGGSRYAWYGASALRAYRPGDVQIIFNADLVSVLADELFDLMTGYDLDTPIQKTWPTRRGAERALALALKDAGATIR